MKIKTTYEGCPYITAGKVYEVTHHDDEWTEIIDDYGFTISLWLDKCPHLDNIGTWEVVQE